MISISISAAILVACVVVCVVSWYLGREWPIVLAVIVFGVTCIVRSETSPEAEAKRKADAEAARMASIPHVIRDADGCKVYAFAAGGHEHFFTRCAESITTERFYSVKVPCGKSCTRDEPRSEVIVTSKGP